MARRRLEVSELQTAVFFLVHVDQPCVGPNELSESVDSMFFTAGLVWDFNSADATF